MWSRNVAFYISFDNCYYSDMPQVICKVCKKYFYAKPSHLQKGWGKYCSNLCQSNGQKTGKYVNCFRCGKKTYRTQKDKLRSKSGNLFCSKRCQTIWRNSTVFIGEKHANWTGGESSYRSILAKSGQPRLCVKCQQNDHRILAVHHKDKNRKNNSNKNLIWLCHNCHFLVHHYEDESEGFLVT